VSQSQSQSLLNKILGSKVYVREKYEHDHYCDGEGEILEISKYSPFDSRTRPCMYCERLRKKDNGTNAEHT
jgi:hypothetical protein